MREIQASEAKTHLPNLLDAVERGETIVVTRHGRAIAPIVPESETRNSQVRAVIADVKAFRSTLAGFTSGESYAGRHADHRY